MKATLRTNLRDLDRFVDASRRYLLHPVMLFAYGFPISMVLIGLFIPEYTAQGLSPAISNIITVAKVLLYWVASWFLLGRVAHRMMHLGIPFVYAPISLWVVGIVLSQTLSVLLIPGFEWSTLRTLKQSLVIIPGTLVALYAAAPMLREGMGHNPDLVPIWRSLRSVPVPLLLQLPPAQRGKLRRIHAANQYVEVVTDTGCTLLRMSLSQAVAMIPGDMGWLCHRSLWINRKEVVSVSYAKGQPQITDVNGKIFPISRSHAPIIKDWLGSRQS